jgi:ATP-dependent helicase/nuclease subunit A
MWEARAGVNVRVITASAGTGKTYRLTQELQQAIESGRARADAVIATTFTTQAAAELIERARARLLGAGRAMDAQRLLAARIGTVNSVCGSLVTDFAFELGVSPQVRVLDEEASNVELRRALARVVSTERARELGNLQDRFSRDHDWRVDIAMIVDAARANGIDAVRLRAQGQRSFTELERCLGEATTDDLDALLTAAIQNALAGIRAGADTTKGTAAYVELLDEAQRSIASARGLPWGAWAKLSKELPTKRSLAHAGPVQSIARRHAEHPRLRRDFERFIGLLYEVAADTDAAYQAHKREVGVVDFVDQEVMALGLLRTPSVRAAIDGQIDLVLIDEFQDTSPIQLALFLELARLAPESIWVGDPKQAIFGFRGTDPSLMDAAIESLSSPRLDAELVERATARVGRDVATLGVSYRSRPGLVEATNSIFGTAFARVGVPPERTMLTPALVEEPAGLGPVIEYWPLELDRSGGTHNAAGRAAAVAAGVRDLLVRAPQVRRRPAGVGTARAQDVAVLCRTNRETQSVADALAALGVPAVVPRMGLLDRAEAQVVRAGLALWCDPDDALAAAELARGITYPTDLDGLLAQVLAAPGRAAFRGDPAVARVLAAREGDPDLAPATAVERVIVATNLRELCAGWGDTAQRLANLDALRAHACIYATESAKSSRAATVLGLLRHFEHLAPQVLQWDQTASDRQALLSAGDAVTVSTWHRSKGLEWPITILFGLEGFREPTSYGVHVVTDREEFDVDDPLGGRWVRYWPNPYTTPNQLGPVRTAVESSPTHATLLTKADRETLRVLYVAWTRARDRLVLAAERGALVHGILKKLVTIAPGAIVEPPDHGRVRWAGLDLEVAVRSVAPTSGPQPAREPGTVSIARNPAVYAPARINPSAIPPVSATVGQIVTLGPRISLDHAPDMEVIGDVIHAFLACDRGGEGSLIRARRLLDAHGVGGSMEAMDLVLIGSRLWGWIRERFGGVELHREWPLVDILASGTRVVGTVDLAIATPDGYVVIDHKSFPGRSDEATDRALSFSGQLAAYAHAIGAATSRSVLATWIHFPIRGQLVEVRIA